MVETITCAMHVDDSIFLSFLKNEKSISSFFDIIYLSRYRLFDTFVFRYRHRRINNLEMVSQFTCQKIFIMLPDDALSRI